MKKITILGSTGSIGVSTLDVIEKNPKAFKVTALAAGRNVKLLAEQIIKYKPEIASVSTREDAEKLRQILGRRKRFQSFMMKQVLRKLPRIPHPIWLFQPFPAQRASSRLWRP